MILHLTASLIDVYLLKILDAARNQFRLDKSNEEEEKSKMLASIFTVADDKLQKLIWHMP